MSYEELIKVLNQVPQNVGEDTIFRYISQDKKILPAMMKLLQYERESDKELIMELNLNNSRNLINLIGVKKGKAGNKMKEFAIDECKKFYMKWKDKIKCCFKIEGLP